MKKFLTTAALSFVCATAQAGDATQTLKEQALGGEGAEIELGENNPPLPPKKFNIMKFDFSRANVDTSFILQTKRMPWDIPALILPRFEEASQTPMHDEDYVVVAEVNGETKAYPLRILNWHRGVNDELGGRNIFVSWDPLSGHASIVDRDIRGRTLFFGDSGMVYRSNTVYFDSESRSLWLPTTQKAITGALAPTKMQTLPVKLAHWVDVKKKYPNIQVLSFDIPAAGNVDYKKHPLGKYVRSKSLLFPIAYGNDALPRKETVLGVTLTRAGKKSSVAFPVNVLMGQNVPKRLEFNFETGNKPGDIKIPLNVEPTAVPSIFKFTSLPEVTVDVQYSYWFSWVGHHPETFLIKQLP